MKAEESRIHSQAQVNIVCSKPAYVRYIRLKKKTWVGEMAKQLRTFTTALEKDPGSVSSTYMIAQNHLVY